MLDEKEMRKLTKEAVETSVEALDIVYSKAYDDGYNDGFSEGYCKAMAEVEKRGGVYNG